MTSQIKTVGYLHPATILPFLELRPGMTVGDFGVGGAAYFTMPLAKAVGSAGSVIMFDILKPALSAALGQARLQGWQNCQSVWTNLEIYGGAKSVRDNSLDAGLMISLLSQSKKYRDILAETGRMLKPGAKMLVVDWLVESDMATAPAKSFRVSADHIEQVARELGYVTAKRVTPGRYHWALLLVKT